VEREVQKMLNKVKCAPGGKPEERREHKRFPVMNGLAEPVDIIFSPSPLESKKPVPGIISNLSAGGMALMTFVPIPIEATISITLNLPGLEKTKLEGIVLRREDKGGTYLHGIRFSHIPEKVVHKLEHLGRDYEDCEIKLSFGVTDVCDKKCHYWGFCTKPVKLK